MAKSKKVESVDKQQSVLLALRMFVLTLFIVALVSIGFWFKITGNSNQLSLVTEKLDALSYKVDGMNQTQGQLIDWAKVFSSETINAVQQLAAMNVNLTVRVNSVELKQLCESKGVIGVYGCGNSAKVVTTSGLYYINQNSTFVGNATCSANLC